MLCLMIHMLNLKGMPILEINKKKYWRLRKVK